MRRIRVSMTGGLPSSNSPKYAGLSPVAVFLLLALTVPSAPQDQRVHRYLLSAGANNGGRDKVILRYAVSDAQAFASVLMDMGGVDESDAFILKDPTRRELLNGIGGLGRLIASGSGGADVKSEVFVYYSGHADEDGLKLAGETLSWAEFRNAVNGLNADVKVAVLDACGSGAITRAKGGVARPAFISDASMNMKGYAFLTSSNENEASQESDRIKGSYFTHALLSGMRGAADLTGDGRVTINEAYQYAFNETLQSTQNTRAGTQHPSRDMNLAGTGDIVMTDLRRTSATLSIAADTEGRFFIMDESGNLFAELRKLRGRPVELGIPPGKYTVRMEAPSRMWSSGSVTVSDGQKTTLSIADMKPMGARRRTVARGGDGEDIFESEDAGAISIFSKCIVDVTAYFGAEGDGLATGLSLRAGTPYIYAAFEIHQPEWRKRGYNNVDFNDAPVHSKDGGGFSGIIGASLGTRFGMNGPFAANLDAVWLQHYTNENHRYRDYDWVDFWGDDFFGDDWERHHKEGEWMFKQYYKLRLGASYIPLSFLSVNAGLSMNGKYECKHVTDMNHPSRALSWHSRESKRGHSFHVWPGVYAGVTVGKVRAGKR